MSDDVRDAEEEALRWAAGGLATERRLERWRWNVCEMPPVDELYVRSVCRSARLDGETR